MTSDPNQARSIRAALVTGGAKRVGAALVRALAEDGWIVVLHYHNSEAEALALAAGLAAAGRVCLPVQADLSRQADIESLIPRALDLLAPVSGRLRCLVNNASSFVYDSIASMRWETWTGHLDPNLAAPAFLSQAFARTVGEDERGWIINMLDQKIEALNPDFFSYTVSKFGLLGLTRLLALALRPRIRVHGIAPGIALPSGKQTAERFEKAWAKSPLGRNATVAEIVAAARLLLNARCVSGSVIVIDGGESLANQGRDVEFLA
ncbi:MAG TPA: SDR family oxidoreductase [Stellaceae bacterium]|nr:SDR family oxidoreductase [Stellaceae bacterium]